MAWANFIQMLHFILLLLCFFLTKTLFVSVDRFHFGTLQDFKAKASQTFLSYSLPLGISSLSIVCRLIIIYFLNLLMICSSSNTIDDDDNSTTKYSMEVVAMGTGSKCIGRNRMNNQGKNLVQLKESYNCLKKLEMQTINFKLWKSHQIIIHRNVVFVIDYYAIYE